MGLAWTTSNASSVTVSASPAQSGWSGSASSYGSKTVTPTTTGTIVYKLLATGHSGAVVSTTVSVKVLAPVLTNGLVVVPPPVIIPTSTPASPKSTPTSTLPITAGIQWGAYAGDSPSSLASFESMVGAPVDVQAIFMSWTDSLPSGYKTTVAGAGKTLAIYWEPTVDDDTINSGSQDAIITSLAQQLSAYGGKVILILNEEVNCDNTDPWGGTYGTNNATKAIAAFQRIHNIVKPIASNVLFAYDVNNDSCYSTAASNSLTAYYPGSAYVDIVGLSGFNFGNPWETWQQTFIGDNSIPTLETLGKPVWILSAGSVDGPLKAQWISDMAAGVKQYNIAGWIWFNQDDATTPGSGDTIDWTINSDPAALTAFKALSL